MRYQIAVDVGGTQLRAARYSTNNNQPEIIRKISTHGDVPPLDRVCELIDSILPEEGEVEAIGVAVPGPTDPYRGIIMAAPNIPGWIDLPIKHHIENCFGVPVLVGNDANLAAMGEWQYGAGIGHHFLIYLTISTGIGGGVIVDDKLLLGITGLAGELGHTTILPDGPICGCGHRGHLEALSSGTAIARWVKEEINKGSATILAKENKINAKMVALAAQNGDELSIAAFERAGTYLGLAISNFLHLFNPTMIILGGGVSHSGEILMTPLRKKLHESVFSPHYLDHLSISHAALGDEAGLMGALVLARSYKLN